MSPLNGPVNLIFSRRGAFSEVVKAQDRESGTLYAIKIIDKKQLKGKEEALQNEIEVLRRCVRRGGYIILLQLGRNDLIIG